jgi:cytochrome P450
MSLPASASALLKDVDLANPRVHADAGIDRVFRQLRDDDPVHWNPQRTEPGFWSVTRYEDCVAVQKDSATFSSKATNVLGQHRWAGDGGSGRMLNATDPPQHTALRQLVSRSFTPRAVAPLEPYLRSVVRKSLDDALGAGVCEFVEVVAMLPVASIAALLGVPEKDWTLLLRLTGTAFGSADDEYLTSANARATAAQTHAHLLLYCQDLMRQRRRAPRGDVVTQLDEARRAGQLTEEEALLFFDLLMLGANETTRHAAVGALLALIENPAQWQLLRDDRGQLDSAVAEVLRWTSPSRHVLRRAERDVWLRGREIAAGQDVAIWQVSANRDERVFASPNRFDIARKAPSHMALGSGPHYCLGASLATLELRVFLDELCRAVATAEVLEPPARLSSTAISGIKHLKVRLRPA